MKISDLTILYVTASEMPDHWMKFQIGHLLKSVGQTPIVSLSRKPMDLGMNCVDSEPKSYWNIYMQMLKGARYALSKYVAMVEDDTLYTKAHFTEFRPKDNEVSYNRARWSLFTWDNIYCLRQRISNCSLIAPRQLLIEALEERAKKYPNGNEYVGEVGRAKVEMRLGVTVRNCVEWYSNDPIVQLNHPSGTDDTQQRKWKKHGQIKAYDIPHWGKATDLIRRYNNELS
jgi:hypothetical protein